MTLIRPRMTRRSLLMSGLATTSILAMPSISRASSRPVFTHGVQSGDITAQGGMVWTRADRPARITVAWRFNLDDLGTEPRQRLGARRSGLVLRHVENAHSF